jgi:hypothetical protein
MTHWTGGMSSIWALRWVMIALNAALAIALMVRGNVVIGVLIGALAVTRAVMFITLRRRRAELARRFPQRFGR